MRLPFRLRLTVFSRLGKFRATWRRTAKFSAPLPFRMRQPSSRKAMSRTRCTLFSVPQWVRSTHHVQCFLAQTAIVRPAQSLAVSRDDLPRGHSLHSLDPLYKAVLKLLGIQGRKHAAECMPCRDSMRHFQKPSQPILIRLSEEFDLLPAIGSSYRSTDGHDQDVQKLVTFVEPARIVQIGEMLCNASQRLLGLHGAPTSSGSGPIIT